MALGYEHIVVILSIFFVIVESKFLPDGLWHKIWSI